MNIKAKVINPLMGEKIPMPTYATSGSAGIDLRACIDESILIQPNETVIIGSGIAIAIDDSNIAATLLPRSGLGIKHGIILANLVGLIDSDYYKEIKIAVWNRSNRPFIINQGDRICQMVFVPIIQARLQWVEELEDNGRDGLGSTGLS